MIPLLIFVASAAIAYADISLPGTHRDSKTHLVIHYPDGWTIDKDSPVFHLFSFPLHKRPRMVIVPMNEASINVISQEQEAGVATIQDWMRRDRVDAGVGDRVTQVEISTQHFGKVSATKVTDNVSKVIPEGRMVLYYIVLKGQILKVTLFYRGREKASYFESVVDAMIRNLELRN